VSAIAAMASSPREQLDSQHFRRWARAIADRGPDRFGVWTTDHAALANAFLRIHAGWPEVQQPFSRDGKVWITADARIDAQGDLLSKLRNAGRSVDGLLSDAELILHAYEVWGVECTQYLFGDFAFVVWDERAQRLLAARDRFGVRPLYYSLTPRALLVSNHANALFRHPDVDRTPDDETIAGFLVSNELGTEEATTFVGIRRVPASHQIIWEGGRLRSSRYWSVPVEEPSSGGKVCDFPAEFWDLVRTAASDAARGAPVGVLLSGGLDSSMLAAALTHTGSAGRITAHTSVWRDLLPDHERPFAELVTRSLGIPGELHEFDAWPAFERVTDVQLASPLPDGSPFSVDTHELLRGVAAHSRLALTGLGPDALLRGEPLVPRLLRGPGRLSTGAGAIKYAWSFRKRPPLGIRPWLLNRRLSQPRPSWLPSRILELASAAANRAPHPLVHRYRPEAYRGTASAYWPSYFEWYHGTAHAAGVRCAHPFFDVRVVTYALRLPAVPWSWDKHLLRLAVAPYLPQEVVNRPKTPLGHDRLAAYVRRHGTGWMNADLPIEHVAPYLHGSGLASLSGAYQRDPDWIHVRPICLAYFLQSWNAQPVIE
jgi:asparagine synthase (glutamine-hydrolysing)